MPASPRLFFWNVVSAIVHDHLAHLCRAAQVEAIAQVKAIALDTRAAT